MDKPITLDSETSKNIINLISPFLTWLVFLILGGGLLAVYYQRIAYIPNIDWRDSLVYLAVLTFIGLAFGLLESLTMFLPGYFWSQEMVHDEALAGFFCFCDGPNPEPCVITIVKILGLPFVVCLVVSHAALWVDQEHHLGKWLYLGVSILLIAISPLYVWYRFVKWPPPTNGVGRPKSAAIESKVEGTIQQTSPSGLSAQNSTSSVEIDVSLTTNHAPTQALLPVGDSVNDAENSAATLLKSRVRARITKYFFWFALTIALNLLSLYLIFLVANWPEGDYLKLSVWCISTVLITNHLVAARWKQNRRLAILFSLGATLLMVGVADHYTFLTGRIMERYGLGYQARYDFVVTDAGDELLTNLGVGGTCGPDVHKKLCSVAMLSGIGPDYYLRSHDINFTIPKSMVVARLVHQPEPKEEKPCEVKP
jgi:hypothetical protein